VRRATSRKLKPRSLRNLLSCFPGL